MRWNVRVISTLGAIIIFLLIFNLISDDERKDQNDYPTENFTPKGINLTSSNHCVKKKKIGFLKTHKCASTSVQSILFRFGLANSLNFVLSDSGNYIGKHEKFSRALLADTDWEYAGLDYHVFALHTIWDQAEVERTLGPGAVYITILRDPLEQFESLWGYSELGNYYNTDLQSFALAEKKGKLASRAFGYLGRNQMLWDAGLGMEQMENVSAVQEKIQELQDHFHLVMMADRFEESMILLKDLLCWDYEDIVNLKLNARKESGKVQLSEEARSELRKYQAADFALYNHFKTKFEQKIKAFGQSRMELELRNLREANERVMSKCGLEDGDNEHIDLSDQNKMWDEKLYFYCQNFVLSRITFIDVLREIQSDRAFQRVLELRGKKFSET